MRTLFLCLSIVCFLLIAFNVQVGAVQLWALGVVFYLCSFLPLA